LSFVLGHIQAMKTFDWVHGFDMANIVFENGWRQHTPSLEFNSHPEWV